jgi:hypothetical protein
VQHQPSSVQHQLADDVAAAAKEEVHVLADVGRAKFGALKKLGRLKKKLKLHELFYNGRLYSGQYVTAGNDGQVCLWSLDLNTMPLHHVRISKVGSFHS